MFSSDMSEPGKRRSGAIGKMSDMLCSLVGISIAACLVEWKPSSTLEACPAYVDLGKVLYPHDHEKA